jgi:hypothetical protein
MRHNKSTFSYSALNHNYVALEKTIRNSFSSVHLAIAKVRNGSKDNYLSIELSNKLKEDLQKHKATRKSLNQLLNETMLSIKEMNTKFPIEITDEARQQYQTKLEELRARYLDF